jgi:type 1 fimbriae regulatory protein FimB/type 1 fimbriae regulatory protein FimE
LLKVVAGAQPEYRATPPRRRPNKEVRVREYLTENECRILITTARKRRGRYGLRDALAIRMCWRHGLRVSELCGLRWDHVEWKTARVTVHRAKGSVDSTHPISGDELLELRAVRRTQEPGCRFIFMNERGAPMTASGFRKMLATVGAACSQPHVHPHMLRHSCGLSRSSGCAGLVEPPGVRTCARSLSVNRRRPLRGTWVRHDGVIR